MSDVPSADDLLSTITDFVNDPSQPSTNADRPIRLATIDPGYVPGTGLPKVTFDGEATMSVKAYPYMGAAPRPGSRVALLPVGTRGYLIAGGVVGSTGGSAGAATLSIISNGAFRANQRGYTSGASIPIGTYCLDRWKASGVTNLAWNPRAVTVGAGTGWGVLFGTSPTALTGLTIPGLSGVTTAVRSTTRAGADGAYWSGDQTTPFGVVVVGKMYTASMWIRSTVAMTFTPSLQFSSSVGSVTSTVAGPNVAVAANTWTRVSVSGIATAARAGVFALSTTAFSAGAFVDGTAVMITEGPILYPYFDGAMTDCSWSGTANAAGSVSYNVPNVVPTLTGTLDPNFGQMLTLNTSARVSQIVERSRVQAGGWIAAHDGTAQMRVYDNLTAPGSRPAFQAGPVIFTADGLDDVVVEFSGGVAGATIGRVRMFSGTTDYSFALPSIGDELRDCERYFEKSYDTGTAPGTATSFGAVFGAGPGLTTSFLWAFVTFKVRKRVDPLFKIYDTSGNANACVRANFGSANTANQPVTWDSTGQTGGYVYSSSGASANTMFFQFTADAELV